ncbi:MAG: glutaredoxin [Gammaproteobacteria bacterium]|nr:glutaredoxin [Gammaproteobacteria bacterium]
MKWLIRMFFRGIRRIIGPIMLLIDKLTTPKGITRPADAQQQLDQQTGQLALYQFKTCPFCMKVRREIKRQSLNIELRDAQHDQHHREQLLQGGGEVKVPCLRIKQEDGSDTWLYESDEVIKYLRALAA